jgi:hypothetical protein
VVLLHVTRQDDICRQNMSPQRYSCAAEALPHGKTRTKKKNRKKVYSPPKGCPGRRWRLNPLLGLARQGYLHVGAR